MTQGETAKHESIQSISSLNLTYLGEASRHTCTAGQGRCVLFSTKVCREGERDEGGEGQGGRRGFWARSRNVS